MLPQVNHSWMWQAWATAQGHAPGRVGCVTPFGPAARTRQTGKWKRGSSRAGPGASAPGRFDEARRGRLGWARGGLEAPAKVWRPGKPEGSSIGFGRANDRADGYGVRRSRASLASMSARSELGALEQHWLGES